MTDTSGTFTRRDLDRLELFRSVDTATIEPVLRNCEVRQLDLGDILIAAGEPNQHLFLVLEGELSVRLESPDSAPLVRISTGDTVGEISLIDKQPATAYVVAESAVRALALDEELIWLLVNTSHGVATNLLFTLAQRLRFGNSVITADREQMREYRFHATVDALTGLFNRHWLNQMLPRLVERCFSSGESLCLLMADIDHFKRYNDQHGHVAGDRALCAVSAALREHLRPADMAARFGGEEFVVLLPNTALDEARIVAERLCPAVRTMGIAFENEEQLPSVTMSFGVAELGAEQTPTELLSTADAALYRAKDAGRDCVMS